jgi:hypothetical protein
MIASLSNFCVVASLNNAQRKYEQHIFSGHCSNKQQGTEKLAINYYGKVLLLFSIYIVASLNFELYAEKIGATYFL